MLDQLIKEYIPELSLYFKRLGLNPEVVTGQWLMTFFCGYFPHPSILMIIDNFFMVCFFITNTLG
jgi:Rab-GTPase-TBC domain